MGPAARRRRDPGVLLREWFLRRMQLSRAPSLRPLAAACAAVVAIAGCGTAQHGSGTPAADAGAISALPQAHPQAVAARRRRARRRVRRR